MRMNIYEYHLIIEKLKADKSPKNKEFANDKII
jgi:hypothetical protein